MLRFLAALAVASILPVQAAGPTHDEALKCYLMTHPNGDPLELERWPTINANRDREA